MHSSNTLNELRIRGKKCPFSTQPGEFNGTVSHWLRKFKNIFHYAEETNFSISANFGPKSKIFEIFIVYPRLVRKPSHDTAPLKPPRDSHCTHKKATIKVKGRQKDILILSLDIIHVIHIGVIYCDSHTKSEFCSDFANPVKIRTFFSSVTPGTMVCL